MSIIRVCLILCCLATGAFAFQAPYDLIHMPKGYGPDHGHTEFGVMGQYVNHDKEVILQTGGFFNVALTDLFRYGIEVDSDSRVFHHFHATVFHSKIPDREEHNLAIGFKNAAWEQAEGIEPAYSVLNIFSVYSISFNDRDFNFHFGLAGDKFEKRTLRTLVGADKDLGFGQYMLEWDGVDFNTGFKVPVLDNLNAFIVYTPTAKSQSDKVSRFLRFGLTFTDNFLEGLIHYDTQPRDQSPSKRRRATPSASRSGQGQAQAHPQASSPYDDQAEKEAVVDEPDEEAFEEGFAEDELSPLPREEQAALQSMGRSSLKSKAITRAAVSHMQKGLEYYYSGQLMPAAREYHMVVSLLPNLSIGYMRLGSIYYRMKEYGDARTYWEQAQELDPDNEDIKQALKTLEQEEAREGSL